MKRSADFIKEEICPEVSKVHYFSDGCAGQYNNCKNFINLCLHEKDFGIECSWSFFSTSHGKSPCDGVVGTLKCLTARVELTETIGRSNLNTHGCIPLLQRVSSGNQCFLNYY